MHLCVLRNAKLINHDCLPILMLLYIMLYIVLAYLMLYVVLAYLMLFAALSNSICLYNASFLPMMFAKAFYFMFCLGLLTNSLFISYIYLHHSQCF